MLRVGLRRVTSLFSTNKKRNTKKLEELFGSGETASPSAILAANKQRSQRVRQEASHRQKVNNYYNYEYFRGEDFIENVPYAHGIKYTARDKLAEQEEKERLSVEELAPLTNHAERAKLIREKINAYHDKQKKYEMQEFEKYLSQYPGTVRGPKPEDDWQAYRAYAMKKMPKTLQDELSFDQKDAIIREEFDKEDDLNATIGATIEAPSSMLSSLGRDRILLDAEKTSKEEQNAWFQEFDQGYEYQQMTGGEHLDVPMLPSVKYENYQHYINHIQDWLNFRNSYVKHNQKISQQISSQREQKITKTYLENEQEWMEVEANIPSLYRYYKCLPKEMQDHPALKDVYLGLEYTSPDYTNEEKEAALNRICPQLLPYDDISEKVMKDYIAHSRVKFSQYMHEKLFTISPEFTWDLGQFLEELRQQELRGQTSNQNKDLRFPEPPERHMVWEEGAPNLPVDFYDNEDGFWDPVISQKLRRYDAHKPMLKTRKAFKH